MKNVRCFIAMAALAFYLTACSGSHSSTSGAGTSNGSGSNTPNATTPSTTDTSGTGNARDTTQHR